MECKVPNIMVQSHRTNNFSEGWNNAINKLVGTTNPSFNSFASNTTG